MVDILDGFINAQQQSADLDAALAAAQGAGRDVQTQITNSQNLLNRVNSTSASSSDVNALLNKFRNSQNNLPSSVNTDDLRIRLKAQPQSADIVYGSSDPGNIMAILHETNGMIFPYTPQINFSQDVDYKAQDMSQSNVDYYTYTRTPSVSLSVSGKFTIQNQREGTYALACIHFLRSCSKMYFGEQASKDKTAGLPPPVLIFNGYGSYMFNNLKVILKSHSFNYDENMDTILVQSAGGTAKLPAMFNITVNLIVQQTPKQMRTQFDLKKFRTGELMKSGGWI